MTSTIAMILAILAFLGTVGLVALTAAATLWFGLRGRRDWARRAALLGGGLAAAYALALFGAGLASSERVLPAGSEKYFCEIDCHLAYVVTNVQVGDSVDGAIPGTWLVTLRTRFDETTISKRRPLDAPLWPSPRRVALIGSDGRRYEWEDRAATERPLGARERDPGAREWADKTDRSGSTPLDQPLRPGESYETVLRFVLPVGVTPVQLFLTDDVAVSRFLIGHERSLGHAPVYLALPAAAVAGR